MPVVEHHVAAGDIQGLHNALNAANSNGEEDIVHLAPGAIYSQSFVGTTVDGVPTGLLVLADGGMPVTINGNGATIARAAGAPEFRLFRINGGAVVTFSGLTLADGNAFDGGGILNLGTLTLSKCTLTGNQGSLGGGVRNLGMLTLTSSTLSGNRSAIAGGGIHNTGTIELTNTTLSGNQSDGDGGGILCGGFETLTNVTLTANRADADSNNFGAGGGIQVPTGTVTLRNTLVAGNFKRTDMNAVSDDISGAVDPDSSSNLIGNGSGIVSGISHGNNSNQVGNVVGNLMSIDPRLGLLLNNGGLTATHALLAGSPAIDEGHFDGVRPANDQRGVGRRGVPDIGAFEFIPPPVVPGGARAIVAALVNKKLRKTRRLFVRVSFADTGEMKTELRSPFQRPASRAIAVAVFDSNGDGIPDSVRLTARKGTRTFTRLFAV